MLDFYETVEKSCIDEKKKDEILFNHYEYSYLIQEFRHLKNIDFTKLTNLSNKKLYKEISKYTGLSLRDVQFVMSESKETIDNIFGNDKNNTMIDVLCDIYISDIDHLMFCYERRVLYDLKELEEEVYDMIDADNNY